MAQHYIRRIGFETVWLDEEWIVIDTERLLVTRLNDVGWHIWTLLGSKQTVDSLAEHLRQDFDAAPDTVTSDVELFLDELRQCGLLEHVGA
jgi:hypothetical protein